MFVAVTIVQLFLAKGLWSCDDSLGSHSGEYDDGCVVAPCSLVEVYRRFTGTCCLHHQGDGSHLPSQKFRVVYRTEKLVTMTTTARHLTLP
jgi:hypothetical protein